MARKNEGLLFELSLLPWWVSATIAAVAFVGIVYVFPSVSIESPLWAFAVPLQSKATYFGIAVAAVFLLPAAVSYAERIRKKRLLDRQRNLESIRDLPWRRFEELVAEAFRRNGFAVIENTCAGADGGRGHSSSKGRRELPGAVQELAQAADRRRNGQGDVRCPRGRIGTGSIRRLFRNVHRRCRPVRERQAHQSRGRRQAHGDGRPRSPRRLQRSAHGPMPPADTRNRSMPTPADTNRTVRSRCIPARRAVHDAGEVSSSERRERGRMRDGDFGVARHFPNAVSSGTISLPRRDLWFEVPAAAPARVVRKSGTPRARPCQPATRILALLRPPRVTRRILRP